METDVGEQQVDEVGQEGSPPPNDALRELVVRAYPDVVPELLSGETVEEMLESVPAARAAYQRVIEQAVPAAPDPVPSGAGASRAFPLDAGAMSPGLKIREGLRQRGL